MNAGERPAEDRRNALYMRAQQNSAAARLTMLFGVAAGLRESARDNICRFTDLEIQFITYLSLACPCPI